MSATEAKAQPARLSQVRGLVARSGLLAGLILLIIVLSFMSPAFLTAGNMLNTLRAVAFNGMIACAMTFLIISGDIDISVGSTVAWSSALLGVLAIKLHWPLGLAVLFVLLQQVILHSLAGWIRVKWNIPAFVVTLTLYMSLRGAAHQITNAYPVTPFPDSFAFWGQGYIKDLLPMLGVASPPTWLASALRIPVPAVMMVITFIIFYFLSTRSVFGRSVYSVGGNEEAARLSGIPVWRTRITCFALSGFLAALSGIILSSRIMSGSSIIAEGLEFEVIAAVIIGGTSFVGGEGSMLGTLLGVLFIGFLTNGMVLLGVTQFWQQISRGLIILFAVLISAVQKPARK